MNKSKKIIEVVSTSVCFFLGCGNIATAEELSRFPQPGNYYRSQDFLVTELPIVSQDSERSSSQLSSDAKEIVAQTTPVPISPTTESQEAPTASAEIESYEPNANPLLFPTTPGEVKTNINQLITLEQAVELALRNNRELEVAKLTLERRIKELREARAALLPDLQAQFQITGQDVNDIGGFDVTTGTTTLEDERIDADIAASVTLSYDLYAVGGIGADIKRAKQQVRFDELAVETAVEQTRFLATSNYYSLQNADAQVEIEKAAIEDASQTLRDAQLLEQAGLGTRFDVLRAEVELANAQQALNTAIANQQGARRQLAETLSLGQQVELKTADEIEPAGKWSLSLEETIVLAYRNRPELEQQVVLRELNQQQRQIALAQIRPQVSLAASYNYSVVQIFDSEIQAEDENSYAISAQLTWTLFDGGTANALSDQAETDIEISDAQFADQRNNVRLEVEQAFYNLGANEKNIGTAQKAVELAEESLRLARLRFQAGVGTQTEVIDAQTELTTSRGNLLTAIIDYNQSLNQLQRAVTNLPDGKLFDLP